MFSFYWFYVTTNFTQQSFESLRRRSEKKPRMKTTTNTHHKRKISHGNRKVNSSLFEFHILLYKMTNKLNVPRPTLCES